MFFANTLYFIVPKHVAARTLIRSACFLLMPCSLIHFALTFFSLKSYLAKPLLKKPIAFIARRSLQLVDVDLDAHSVYRLGSETRIRVLHPLYLVRNNVHILPVLEILRNL